MQTPLMATLRWLRVPGDTIFAVGALSLAWFVIGLRGGRSLVSRAARRRKTVEIPGGEPAPS
jgi:nitric oxide reductase subunit B